MGISHTEDRFKDDAALDSSDTIIEPLLQLIVSQGLGGRPSPSVASTLPARLNILMIEPSNAVVIMIISLSMIA